MIVASNDAHRRLVRARAPLRLGLAGGGTDVSPYCDQFGGFVLNATIDKHAFATLTPSNDGMVRFVAADLSRRVDAPAAPVLPLDGTLDLHKAAYNWAVRELNGGEPLPITLTTFSDAPAGSGLGSSSTMVVAMLRALCEFTRASLSEYELAHAAYEVERRDAGLAGGRQDQYSAAFGGCNFMEFYGDERVIVNPLRIKTSILFELEVSLVLYFTGVSRESASIIAEQTRNMERNDVEAVNALHDLKAEAVAMKESLLKGDFNSFVTSMQRSWESKKRTAHLISNPGINSIYEAALKNGARAGKVSGAGGGGFMMFFANPEQRMQLIRTLETFGGTVMNCQFTSHGAESWRPTP